MLSDILSFTKCCYYCKVKLELNTCTVCNHFIDICENCTNELITTFFTYKDIYYLGLDDEISNILVFIKILSSNPNTFCKNCTILGLHYNYNLTIENVDKIRSIINLYLKKKFTLFLDLKKNIKI